MFLVQTVHIYIKLHISSFQRDIRHLFPPNIFEPLLGSTVLCARDRTGLEKNIPLSAVRFLQA